MSCCPFCGSDKTKVETKSKNNITRFGREEYVSASVRCNVCYARGPIVTGKRADMNATKFEAEKLWNAWTSRVYNVFVEGQ